VITLLTRIFDISELTQRVNYLLTRYKDRI